MVRYFLSLFSLALYLTTNAQLTLNNFQAYADYAIKNNPDIKRSAINELIERQNYYSSIGAVLPVVRASFNLTDNLVRPTTIVPGTFIGRPDTSLAFQFGRKYLMQPGFDASWNVMNAAGVEQIRIAKKNVEIAKLSASLNEEQLRAILASSYYNYLLTKANLLFIEKNLSVSDSLKRIAATRFRNGLVDELEVNRTKTQHLRNALNLSQSQTLTDKALNELKVLVNLPTSEKLVITENIAVPQTLEADLTALNDQSKRTQAKVAAMRVEVAKMNRTKEGLKYLPDVNLFGNYNWQSQSDKFSDQKWYKSSAVGLKIETVIFGGGQKAFAIKRADLNYQSAKIDLDNTLHNISKDNESLRLDYQKSVADISMVAELLQLSERNYTLANYKYSNQILPFDQLLNVYTELLNAQQQYLEKISGYYAVKNKIQAIVNQ